MGATRRYRRALSRQQQLHLLREASRSEAELVAEGQLLGDGDLYEAWSLGSVLHIVPAVTEDMPPAVRNALAARREASLRGRCPACGARRRLRDGAADFLHEDWCTAGDEMLGELARFTGWVKDPAYNPRATWPVPATLIPRLVAKAEPAFAAAFADPVVRACRHVVAHPAAPASLCFIHPTRGLACPTCHNRHIRDHPPGVDFTCDACGAVVEKINSVPWPVAAGGVVRDSSGRERPFRGVVIGMGLGLCPGCGEVAA